MSKLTVDSKTDRLRRWLTSLGRRRLATSVLLVMGAAALLAWLVADMYVTAVVVD